MRSLRQAAGFAMIEVMVTVVIVAFGLLGIAGLISRSFVTEVEGTQRTQALLLLQDMASRLESNRGNVGAYVTDDIAITGYTGTALTVCNPASALADRDRCEWGRMLAGASEQIGTRNAGVLVGARGCVYFDDVNESYVIAIAWQGMTDIPRPDMVQAQNVVSAFEADGCGKGLYGSGSRRRLMSLLVRLGTVGA